MVDIRHFFRYELSGSMLLLYLSILLLPLINIEDNSIDLTSLKDMMVLGVIIAIPIGWVLYQIYDYRNKHVQQKSIDYVKNWKEIKYNCNNDNYIISAIDIGISNSINDNKYMMENLISKYNHAEAGNIIGIYVPISAFVMVGIILFILDLTSGNFINPIIKNPCWIIMYYLIFIIYLMLFYIIMCKKVKVIKDKIYNIEKFFIMINRRNIIICYNKIANI